MALQRRAHALPSIILTVFKAPRTVAPPATRPHTGNGTITHAKKEGRIHRMLKTCLKPPATARNASVSPHHKVGKALEFDPARKRPREVVSVYVKEGCRIL